MPSSRMSRIPVARVRVAPRIRHFIPILPALLALLVLAGCSRSESTGPPGIALNNGNVEVTGLDSGTLRALRSATDAQWTEILRVAVSADAPPMLGSFAVDGDVVRFTPAFPLDAGRQYDVRFTPEKIPGGTSATPALTAQVGRPAEHTEPSTTVTRVYPSGPTVPENVLRMYIEFSAPMGRKSGVEYLTLLDDTGKEIPGAVLPLDYEFWSPDHRRFTVFFDPGRVKDGILPNREMGRAFVPGKKVTLVISKEWRDEHGLPLKEEHRRSFEVLPADARPLDPATWRITAPAAGGRSPLVVTFPKALDQSLLLRGLGVRRNGNVVEGDAEVAEYETKWIFTPKNAWAPGTYQFLAFDILEDIAGNQVGRAFEVDNFDTVDKDPDPKEVVLPFTVK